MKQKRIRNEELIDIGTIHCLFEEKKWEINTKNKSSLYNRYFKLYTSLNEDEKKVFLKLSYQFEVIDIKSYQEKLISLLTKVIEAKGQKSQELYIMPIKKKDDIGKVKSSDFMTYLCSSTSTYYNDTIYKKKILILGNINEVIFKKEKFNQKILYLMDDFIGTGKYVLDVVNELAKEGISKGNIVVVCMYLHDKGRKLLEENQIEYECLEVVNDSILTSLSKEEKSIMSEWEDRMHIEEEFKFGYGGSASLLTLIRTPNNTFPIFWMDKNKKAPFPRRKK